MLMLIFDCTWPTVQLPWPFQGHSGGLLAQAPRSTLQPARWEVPSAKIDEQERVMQQQCPQSTSSSEKTGNSWQALMTRVILDPFFKTVQSGFNPLHASANSAIPGDKSMPGPDLEVLQFAIHE